MKIFVRSLLCVSLSIPAFTSCYDDSALWDKVNDMEARLNELEVEMTSQVEAMQALLSNGATLTSCKKNSDGSYTVTLSNGTKFKVLPEGTDFSRCDPYGIHSKASRALRNLRVLIPEPGSTKCTARFFRERFEKP